MTAKEVSVGLTYEVKVSDVLVPVTLTSECPYGGWYGKNLATDHTVRIKTAGRLRKQLVSESERQAALQANEVHTTTMEATVPATTDRAAAKAKRAARRTAKPAATVHNTEESNMPAKPAAKTPTNIDAPYGFKPDGVTPRKRPEPTWLNGAKPAAKAKAKPAAKRRGTVKMTADVVAPTTPDTITMDQAALDAIVAAAVAKALGEAGTSAKAVNTAARKRKPTGKPVTVKLAPEGPKVNSFAFKYNGKDDNPLVTAVYIMIPLLERFAVDGTPVEVAFTPYMPTGKQNKRPKSRVRYSGDDETIRDLYVNRAGIEAMGYTDDICPTITVEVLKGNNIALTFTPNS